ncbi:MAG: aminodeoxychorismate synthase component I [Flavobacterium sp. BFFFF2]|nr:MAG: aminodeoxychorismate synthase component I [Flavobacterium sp. BFFFF2]
MTKRIQFTQTLDSVETTRQQLMGWGSTFVECLVLDGRFQSQPADLYESHGWMMAVDAFTSIKADETTALANLQDFQGYTRDWLFGFMGYDLKNAMEPLPSNLPQTVEFPMLYFFQPKRLFKIEGNQLIALYLPCCEEEWDADWKAIQNWQLETKQPNNLVNWEARLSKEVYIEKIHKLQAHIQRGDIYEVNFCTEFYSTATEINPLLTYEQLCERSKAPFAAYLKWQNNYLLCASPERYIKKSGSKLISQPIKGTARRSTDKLIDSELAHSLQLDPKERAENIMIVDLVRNDLSRVALSNSLEVNELCRVYTFSQVHQLISTISCNIPTEMGLTPVLKASFPMGSMTGAPKIRAMELIEAFEVTQRGLYSGSLGYITPEGDFDFNVVIRSLMFDANRHYASCSVGSAITALSDPEQEYEECLLKAKAIKDVLLQLSAS